MKLFSKTAAVLRSNIYVVFAAQLVFALTIAAFPLGQAEAVQLNDRQVALSDSAPSGGSISSGVGSGTNVALRVQFTTTNTTSNIGGIVIDFCSNTPLVGDSCTAPTGLNTNKATTAIANASGMGTGAFAVSTTDAGTGNANRFILTRATPTPLTATVSFDLGNGTTTGITNPSTLGTFYARIYTYAAAGNSSTAGTALGHNTSASTGYVDYGSVALSTANTITITARVQENIIFCVSAAAPSANCTSTTTPAITIGHNPSGGSKYIDSSVIDTGIIYTQVSTNAGSGAIVTMRNGNSSCGGLSRDGGTTCGIPPTNAGAATTPTSGGGGGSMTAGTSAFGLAVTAGSGMSAYAPYDGNASSNLYGMDSTTTGSNVTTTFGSRVIHSSGPISNVNSTWQFAATASNATPAGLYSANIAAIATGTF